MKWLRRTTLLLAVLTYIVYLGNDRLRADECTGGASYFNYGWEAYGCGLYTEGNACAEARFDCILSCSGYSGWDLDWCYETQVGDPSDGWYSYSARCTCYI